jgi:hypothetical protein
LLVEKGLFFRGKAKAKRAQQGESARDTHYLVPADHGNCVAIVHGNSFRHAPNLIGHVGHRLSDRKKISLLPHRPTAPPRRGML